MVISGSELISRIWQIYSYLEGSSSANLVSVPVIDISFFYFTWLIMKIILLQDKQKLRMQHMFRVRHMDNYLEYLQVRILVPDGTS